MYFRWSTLEILQCLQFCCNIWYLSHRFCYGFWIFSCRYLRGIAYCMLPSPTLIDNLWVYYCKSLNLDKIKCSYWNYFSVLPVIRFGNDATFSQVFRWHNLHLEAKILFAINVITHDILIIIHGYGNDINFSSCTVCDSRFPCVNACPLSDLLGILILD